MLGELVESRMKINVEVELPLGVVQLCHGITEEQQKLSNERKISDATGMIQASNYLDDFCWDETFEGGEVWAQIQVRLRMMAKALCDSVP